MSDILSNYFKNLMKQKIKSLNHNKQSTKLSHDLSNYGILLSKNNILSFTPKKSFSTVGKINFDNKYPKIYYPNFNSDESNSKYNIQKIKSNDNNIMIKINDEFPSTSKDNVENQNIINNKNNNSPNNDKYITKKKNDYLFEQKENKINLIIDNLMKRKSKHIKKKHYIKRTFSYNDISLKQSTIDPMYYIRMNLSENPHNSDLYQSYKMQINTLGQEKFRKLLLDGINIYRNKIIKYRNLKWSMGYDINNEDNKINNKKINMMLDDQKSPKFIFNIFNNNYKKKKKIIKNIKSFSSDKEINSSKDNRIDNLHLKLNAIKKNDIDKLGNYLTKNYKYLSFDKKLDLILLKSKKTSNYINKKTNLYHRINKIIFQSQ